MVKTLVSGEDFPNTTSGDRSPSGGPQWGTRTQPATDGRKVVGSTAWGGEVPQSDLDLVPWWWTATGGGVKCGENMKKNDGN